MFKITPPHVAFRNLGSCQNSFNVSGGAHHCACRLFLYVVAALFVALIIWSGYKAGVNAAPQPLTFSRALYFNGDSLRYYAQKAYLEEDPHALFVTGAAAYMSRYANLPDTLPTVSLDEGAIMLLRAAELGEQDAVTLIHCLDAEGVWGHSIPE